MLVGHLANFVWQEGLLHMGSAIEQTLTPKVCENLNYSYSSFKTGIPLEYQNFLLRLFYGHVGFQWNVLIYARKKETVLVTKKFLTATT